MNTKEHAEASDLGDYNTKFKAKEYVQVGGHGKKNLHLWHKWLGHFNVKDIKLLA